MYSEGASPAEERRSRLAPSADSPSAGQEAAKYAQTAHTTRATAGSYSRDRRNTGGGPSPGRSEPVTDDVRLPSYSQARSRDGSAFPPRRRRHLAEGRP
jgi:hypothetical protein